MMWQALSSKYVSLLFM